MLLAVDHGWLPARFRPDCQRRSNLDPSSPVEK
jgi:hypothetical protein